MTKYNELPINWVNDWIVNKLRGIPELGAPVVIDDAIIPAAAAYTTDVDTNDRYEDADSAIEVPFFSPGGQQPDTKTLYNSDTKTFSNLPFATYSFMGQKIKDEPWMICEQATYVIYSGNSNELFEILNYVRDLTKREDWSAYDMNWFYRSSDDYPFDMKVIEFLSSAGPAAMSDEGGLQNIILSIGYDCTYEGSNRAGEYGDESGRGTWI